MDALGPQNYQFLSGNTEVKSLHVKARIHPGLFSGEVGGEQVLVRSSRELRPGKLYSGALLQQASQFHFLFEQDAGLSLSESLVNFRAESSVPQHLLSDALLQFYSQLGLTFEPQQFRRVYLRLEWLLKNHFPALLSPGGTSLLQADVSQVSISADESSMLSEIMRLLCILEAKGLPLGDSELASLIKTLLPSQASASEGVEYPGRPDDDGPAGGETSDDSLVSEEAQFAIARFNNRRRNTSSRDSHRREQGWLIIPVEDDLGRKALLRLNPDSLEMGIHCRIKQWSFLWFGEHPKTIFFRRNSLLSESHGPEISEALEELSSMLKPVNIQRVAQMSEMSSFDGFSSTFQIFGSGTSIEYGSVEQVP